MELFDEIIQNKQLEDTITERQVLRVRKNIGKRFAYTVDALVHNAEEAKRKDQLRSADPILFFQ